MFPLSKKASEILARKEDNWEYLLAFEILEPELERLSDQYYDLRTCPPIAGTVLDRDQSFVFCQKRIEELQKHLPTLADLMNVTLPKAQGPLGKAGNAGAIIEACQHIVVVCDVLFEWDKSLHTTVLHCDCDDFSFKASGMTEGFLVETRRILGEMRDAVENSPENPGCSKVMEFRGTFDTSPLDHVRVGTSGISGATESANRSHSVGCLVAIGAVVVGGYFFGPLGAAAALPIAALYFRLTASIIDICPLDWWPATEKFLNFVQGAFVLICILAVIRIAWASGTQPPVPQRNQPSVSASPTAQPTPAPTSTPLPVLNRKEKHKSRAAPHQGLDFGPGAPGG